MIKPVDMSRINPDVLLLHGARPRITWMCRSRNWAPAAAARSNLNGRRHWRMTTRTRAQQHEETPHRPDVGNRYGE